MRNVSDIMRDVETYMAANFAKVFDPKQFANSRRDFAPIHQTDLDVSFRFVTSAGIEACAEYKSDDSYTIAISDRFASKLSTLLACLFLADEDPYDTFEELGASPMPAEVVEFKTLFINVAREHGVGAIWDVLSSKDCNDAYFAVLARLLHSPLKVRLVDVSAFAALMFFGCHEACHAFGGHLIYRRRRMWDMSRLTGAEFQGLMRDQYLFELTADQAARDPLFFTVGATALSFDNFVRSKQPVEDEKKSLPYEGIYCAAMAMGFGIATIFLLTDVLVQTSSEEDYHPPALERIILTLGSSLQECVTAFPPAIPAVLLRMYYERGLFEGGRRALKVWDGIGLFRKPNSTLEAFLKSKTACLLCNVAAPEIIERFGDIANRAEKLYAAMSSFGIEEKSCGQLRPTLRRFSELHDEFAISRRNHERCRDEAISKANDNSSQIIV
jgi:hypothetical protein